MECGSTVSSRSPRCTLGMQTGPSLIAMICLYLLFGNFICLVGNGTIASYNILCWLMAWSVFQVREWLLPSGRQTADILSIGLLETVELSANALFVHEASPESKKWEELIFALLDVPNKYKPCHSPGMPILFFRPSS